MKPADKDWSEAFGRYFWPDWLLLGRDCSKAAAYSAWMGVPHASPQEDFERLDAAFKKARDGWAESASAIKFIPHAATWLNDYRKNIELEVL